MAIFGVTAGLRSSDARWREPAAPALFEPFSRRCARAGLARAASSAAPGPIVAFIHGYLYEPNAPAGSGLDRRRNPHRLVLEGDAAREDAFAPLCRRRPRRLLSWPQALGFGEAAAPGLALAFGWSSFPPPIGALLARRRNSFSLAYAAAPAAARALAEALKLVIAADPHGRRVDLFAHSLGARVAFLTLRQAASEGWADRLGLILALGACEYREKALRAASRTGAPGPAVINVLCRANDPFDLALELFGPRPTFSAAARPLGAAGLGRAAPGWLDLQLDHPAQQDWLAREGVGPASRRRLCHWAVYTRAGLMAFYRRVLSERLGPDALRRRGARDVLEPRWSRLAPLRRPDLPAPAKRLGAAVTKA